MKAYYRPHLLEFKQAGGTSRGVLYQKETWFLLLYRDGKFGIGECGLFRGLSRDDRPDYEQQLKRTCRQIHLGLAELLEFNRDFPSIRIGLETAFRSLEQDDPFEIFPSDFTSKGSPISINGLVWMGEVDFMRKQIEQKIDSGYDCIKLKIGALDFETEIQLLKEVRNEFSADQITLRVDANGAFKPQNALAKLERLAELEIHSIEQPVSPGQWEVMGKLCRNSPVPIALDEELIGLNHPDEQRRLMEIVRPQYLILKPSLLGGFLSSDRWIDLADQYQAGWWVTSALESNIGLNAIAQYTFTKSSKLPQGLGTGSLFKNNITSPLVAAAGELKINTSLNWDISTITDPIN